MTNETVPELPDWVKVLIADARSEGYEAGLREGEAHAWGIIGKIASNGIASRQ